MLTRDKKSRDPEETKRKLVGATVALMLRQGFNATSVDEICAEAGVTKGSFFHHFATKEAIGRAGMEAFAAMGMGLYADAHKDPSVDPLEQIHRLIDIMIGFNQRGDDPCVCMIGMMSQEMSRTNSDFRKAGEKYLSEWAEMVAGMLTAAKKVHPPKVDFDAERVAWFLNSLWQGSMLISKTRQMPEMTISNLRMARAYVDGLFGISADTETLPNPVSKSSPTKTPKR